MENDLLKVYLFSRSDKFSFSHIDSLVRSVSAKLFMLLMPPGIFPDSIDRNLPILNYGNIDELQNLLDSNVVLSNNIYNLPKNLINANSKVEFHKKTDKLPFVPKTVFNKGDVNKLKFPVIAKPDTGSKGEGIKVFKSKEDLDASKDVFDVFSEKMDLKREFRVISIKGNLAFIAERIPKNDKANSLREGVDVFDRSGTLDGQSSYDWKDVQYDMDGIPSMAKFSAMCSEINSALGLEFLGIDIGLDSSNELFVIEANTCPGLNKDQIVLIYETIFNDFYKRQPSRSQKELDQYKQELKRANNDTAKFSFSAHQGNNFYDYDDKVDLLTGKRLGRSVLSMKYNIEKSMGNTLKNIKKQYENKILDFHSYFLNEENKNLASHIDILQKLVDGKLKPIEVNPNDGLNKKKLSFDESLDGEEGDKKEEIEIFLPNDESLFIDFTWSCDIKRGSGSGNRLDPDSSDEYILTDIDVTSVKFYSSEGDEHVIELDKKNKSLVIDYLESVLPIDGKSSSYLKHKK